MWCFSFRAKKAAYCETTLQEDGRERLRYWMLKEGLFLFYLFFFDVVTISQL